MQALKLHVGEGRETLELQVVALAVKHRGYYLFHHTVYYGHHSSADTIQGQHLLLNSAQIGKVFSNTLRRGGFIGVIILLRHRAAVKLLYRSSLCNKVVHSPYHFSTFCFRWLDNSVSLHVSKKFLYSSWVYGQRLVQLANIILLYLPQGGSHATRILTMATK